eukprot:274919_1
MSLSADEAEEWRKINHDDEGDTASKTNNQGDIKDWMNKHGLNVSDDTIRKLNAAGFSSITDLEQCTLMEIKEYSKSEHMNIKIADRIKLQRAVELLGNKTRIINPEEIEILKCIDQKLAKLEIFSSSVFSSKQKIMQQRRSIEMAIDFGFNALIEALNTRKKVILKQLDDIMEEKSNFVSKASNYYNATTHKCTKLRDSSHQLVSKAINMNELEKRTAQLNVNKRHILKLIIETNKKYAKANMRDKINFVLDTKQAAIGISKLGMFTVTETRHKIDSCILTETYKISLMDM